MAEQNGLYPVDANLEPSQDDGGEKSVETVQTKKRGATSIALAIAALVIGFLFVCPASLYKGLSGWNMNALVYSTFAVVLGGISMIYGSVKLIRSLSPQTTTSSSWQNFLVGAATGGITFLIVDLVFVIVFITSRSYTLILIAYMYILGAALLFGLPAGGIGGWLLGRFWKNKNAAVIGGLVIGVISSLLAIVLAYR